MTQAWTTSGARRPVTVVQVPLHTITQVKTVDSDGYEGVQLGIEERKAKHTSKSMQTKAQKIGLKTFPKLYKEVRMKVSEDLKVGNTLSVQDVLTPGDMVNVASRSKGRGFAGVVKRYGFKGGPKTHGQSDRLRAPGSIGQGTTPGRVYPGKRMAGHYGQERFTIKNLTVLKVDVVTNTVWLSGPIPGGKNTLVTIKKTGTNKKFVPLLEEVIEASSTLTESNVAPISKEDAESTSSQAKVASSQTPAEKKDEEKLSKQEKIDEQETTPESDK